MVLVDSNVLIDIFTNDPVWHDWSAARLAQVVAHDDLAINPVIYAELAAGFDRPAQLERALAHWPLTRLPLPYEAGFAAGHAFLAYRREGGTRRSPLPDFYIGAHAAQARMPLLTRDAARYRRHFPRLKLLAPDSE